MRLEALLVILLSRYSDLHPPDLGHLALESFLRSGCNDLGFFGGLAYVLFKYVRVSYMEVPLLFSHVGALIEPILLCSPFPGPPRTVPCPTNATTNQLDFFFFHSKCHET